MRAFRLTHPIGLGILFLLVTFFSEIGLSQQPPTEREKRIAELEKNIAELQAKLEQLRNSEVGPKPRELVEPGIPEECIKGLGWRCVGPATMGGRITGLAVFEADPTTFYVATASGGVIKTTNGGATFEHQFDKEATVSIGAIAVSQKDRNIVWVGTGEANPRNSVSYGDGVYKSTDGGKTWQNMGLKTSFQIGAIYIHPQNPDVVFVGALGRLYGPGGERGLYKTEDGGKTWKPVLQVDETTGVIDIAVNPSNPEQMLVAMWERQRDEFDSILGDAKAPPGADGYAPAKVHGAGSGLWRSIDGGKTFHKVTKGLPNVKLGRIGLDWSRKSPNTVFAIVDSEKAGMGRAGSGAYLGIQGKDAKEGGALLTAITKDGPAEKAGLKADDIVTQLAGKKVNTYLELVDILSTLKANEKTKLTLQRGKETKQIEVTPTLRPGVSGDGPALGIRFGNLDKTGLLINDVVPEGSAAKGGLKAKDILTSIEGNPLTETKLIDETLKKKKVGNTLTVTYIRDGQKKEATLKLLPMPAPERPFAGQLGGNAENVQNQQGPDGVNTGGVYRSTDGGETWTRINSINPRPFYFSLIRVDPNDDNTLYVGGIKLARSTDGGRTFDTEQGPRGPRGTQRSGGGLNSGLHDDHHDLWINPKDSRHLIVGTDGGLYQSFDKANHWDHLNQMALGQFYHVTVDNKKPYNIYGGLQDNGSWGGPSRTLRVGGPINEDWIFVGWGDGFVCRVDPKDPDIIYYESQDGNTFRRNLRTGASDSIRPAGSGLRFNWNTPYILSAHNGQIVYLGTQYLHRSVSQGSNSRIISPELTRTKRGSATAISESPKNPDVLYVGTDDGFVWVTRDGGKNWTELSPKLKQAGLPGYRWVASLETSRFVEGRVYVAFDAHRSNDDEPYIFVSEDFGETWKSIRSNLPSGSTRVLREDLLNPNLLYVGTEFAAWASINRGASWTKINGTTLPTVAIHEFAQPTTANEIVVATHGRSVWVADVSALRQLTPDLVKGNKTALLAPDTVVRYRRQPTSDSPFSSSARRFVGTNPPAGTHFDYVLAKPAEKVSLKVTDASGTTLQTFFTQTKAGYHRVTWNLVRLALPKPAGISDAELDLLPMAQKALFSPGILAPGTYRVVLTVDGKDYVQPLVVEPDPNAPPGASTATDYQMLERELKKILNGTITPTFDD